MHINATPTAQLQAQTTKNNRLAVSKQIAESQGRDSLNALFLVRTYVPGIYIDSNDRNFTRFKKGI